MKLFISWSKTVSRDYATCFRDWINRVIQDVQPFMSDQDIELGEKGISAIETKLDEIAFGIIFVTRENKDAPWIHYEAGALSRTVDSAPSRVVPLLIDLEIVDLGSSPLSNYQGKKLGREAVLSVCSQINKLTSNPLQENHLADSFEVWWPKLEACWSGIQVPEHSKKDVTLEDISGSVEELTKLVISLRNSEQEQTRLARALSSERDYFRTAVARNSFYENALVHLDKDVGAADVNTRRIVEALIKPEDRSRLADLYLNNPRLGGVLGRDHDVTDDSDDSEGTS